MRRPQLPGVGNHRLSRALATALLLACGDNLGPRIPAAIVVTPETPEVPLDGTLQLTATVVDASGGEIEDAPLFFQSNADATLAVDNGGLLTSVGDTGTALITVASGEITARVEAAVVLPPSALLVRPRSFELDTGEDRFIRIILTDANGEVVPDAEISFQSSDPTIARGQLAFESVYSVVGLGAGTATITISGGGMSTQVEATVSRFATSIAVTPNSLVLPPGSTQQVTAALLDRTGDEIDALEPFTWSSSNEAVATVSPTGMVTSTGLEGSAIITAAIDTLSVGLGVFVGTPPAGEKLATLPFDQAAEGVAVAPDGRFFVAGYGRFASGTLPGFAFSQESALLGPGDDVVLNSSLTRAYLVGTQVHVGGLFPRGTVVMDLTTNSAIDFIPSSMGLPFAGALSEDETILTVGTEEGFERIDLATKRSLGASAIGFIGKITRNPVRPLLYASGGGSVFELDPATGEVIRKFGVDAQSHAVTSDGSKLYTVNLNGEINVWDLETGEQERLPRVVAGNDVVLSPDDRFLYVLRSSNHIVDGSRVYIVDPQSGALLRTVILGGLTRRIAMSSDGIAIVTNEGGEIGWVDFVR